MLCVLCVLVVREFFSTLLCYQGYVGVRHAHVPDSIYSAGTKHTQNVKAWTYQMPGLFMLPCEPGWFNL